MDEKPAESNPRRFVHPMVPLRHQSWKRGCFAWEHEGKRKDLREAYR